MHAMKKMELLLLMRLKVALISLVDLREMM